MNSNIFSTSLISQGVTTVERGSLPDAIIPLIWSLTSTLSALTCDLFRLDLCLHPGSFGMYVLTTTPQSPDTKDGHSYCDVKLSFGVLKPFAVGKVWM